MSEEIEQSWKLRTLKDAYQDREPTRYIVERFFATHTLNMVFAAPASLKSMILADLIAAVVSGHDWLPGLESGGGGVAVTQCAALWVDMDNGTRRTDERFSAIGKAHRLTPDAPLFYISMPTPPLHLTNLDTVLMLIDAIRECQAQIVVLDNLGLIAGEVEENSAKMAEVMGYLRVVAERTGVALIVIHHQRKGGANGGRAGEALRGHSSIEAAIDLALHITREEQSNMITIKSTKTRGVDVPTVTAQFVYEHIPGTSDLETAYFQGVKPERKSKNPIRDAILSVLAEHKTLPHSKLCILAQEACGESRGKVRAWVDGMLESGDLKEKKGKHNARVIFA